jgi:exo-beta-1,3-glucanase (GH17 family)
MRTEVRSPNPNARRGLAFHVILASFLIAPVVGLYVRHMERMRANRPTSEAFRQYLGRRGARLVVYSPELTLTGDDHRRNVWRQLALLRSKFDGLVIYRCDQNTQTLLEAASSLGYRAVLLTVWDPNSDYEVKTAAQLATRFEGQLSVAVSIGSEGLMEGRYTIEQMKHAAQQLRAETGGPVNVEVTTAEPWWLYVKQDEEARRLGNFGDFVSTNIHVVWDADIADPIDAAEWTADRAIEVQQGTRKVLLVREAGFPGGGESPRASAHFRFNRDMQAKFWAAWHERAASSPLPPIAAFEAIDNPQKDWQSFEGDWGLLSKDLRPYPAWDSFTDLPDASVAVSR